jgi:hypothetical protein
LDLFTSSCEQLSPKQLQDVAVKLLEAQSYLGSYSVSVLNHGDDGQPAPRWVNDAKSPADLAQRLELRTNPPVLAESDVNREGFLITLEALAQRGQEGAAMFKGIVQHFLRGTYDIHIRGFSNTLDRCARICGGEQKELNTKIEAYQGRAEALEKAIEGSLW